jgi:transcriptional regulator with XRE-family HTH domain
MQQTVGERLAAARIARGLSQRELAERAGVAHGTVARAERDKQVPHFRSLRKICAVLGISLEEITGSIPKAPARSARLPRELEAARAEYASFEEFVDSLDLEQLETLGHVLAVEHHEALSAGDRPRSMELYAQRLQIGAAIERLDPPLARVTVRENGRAEVTYLRAPHSEEEQEQLDRELEGYIVTVTDRDLVLA